MEYMQPQTSTQQTILCCQCGTPTPPNASNLCIGCIRSQVDITEGIQKQAYLHFCKGCERYMQPPNLWISCLPESRELLGLCLKKLKGLSKVHLVDAGFIWTEPHSKRVKVKLTIQREVLNSTILQQIFVVDYIVQGQMCDDCHRREAKDFWKAVVQIRQKVPHKKTFLYLEQVIMKHNIHSHCLNIKQVHEGLDFYFANKNDGRKMVDFLLTVVPCRYKTSERLISHDIHNNTYNNKSTFSVELVPICKNDVVCLPLKVARSMGNISQISICYKVSNTLHFVDPFTGTVSELSPTAFWRTPFAALCSTKQLSEFTVIECEKDHRTPANAKFCQADIYLMRNNDMMGSDAQFHCRTHLGHLLQSGDTVLGYDFTTTNLNDANLEKMKQDQIPDVVIVKKSFGDKKKRSRNRAWKLKQLTEDVAAKEDADYDEFLEDIEEDKEFRQNINIYRDRTKMIAERKADEDDLPVIALEEMLDDLVLEDQPMDSDDEN